MTFDSHLRRVGRAAGVLLTIAALAACTKVDPSGKAAGRNTFTVPGVLRIATAADPKNLNPLLAASQPTLELSAFLFSWTVLYDEHAQPYPEALAEIPTLKNGGVSADGLTLRYKLRRNMKWHDGVKVTCNDLRFTWQAVMNTHNNVITTDGYKDIRSIDCRDPYVAVIHMKRLYAPFLQQLWAVNGNAPILPEHLLAKVNDAKGSLNTAPYNSAPIASGPFQFVSWTRGDNVRLKAFPEFYLDAPKLKEVIYRILADQNTLVTQIETHEIDVAFHAPAGPWVREQRIPGVIAVAPSVFNYDHLDFNMRRPMFADVRLREALADAIDRPALLSETRHGLGVLSETDESPEISGAFTNDVPHHPYDPAKARALLDAAGWHVGRGGIRARNGVRLSFAISTQSESTAGRQLETLVQRYWRSVGAEALVKNYPTSIFFENDANGILQGGKYDVAFFDWSAAADPDDSPIYSADNFAPHGQNALFWNDPVATRAMNDALQTVNFQRRVADYHIVQRELAAQVPTIILWFRKEPQLYNSDLKNFRPTPVITTPFWNTWEYSI